MKNNKKSFVILFIIAIIIVLLIFLFINKNTIEDKDKLIKEETPSISYEEFKNLYEEYNIEDYNINENNYSIYEDEMFSNKYSKMIECEFKVIGDDGFLIINNNSDEYLGLSYTSIIFYDNDNKIIDIKNAYLDDLEAGGKYIESVYEFPKTYAKVDFFTRVNKPTTVSKIKTSRFKCEVIDDEYGKAALISNNNNEKCESLSGIIIYYDEEKNAIDYSYVNIYDGLKEEETKKAKIYHYATSYSSYEFIVSYLR